MIESLRMGDRVFTDKLRARQDASPEPCLRRQWDEAKTIRSSPGIRAIGNRAHAALVRSGGIFEWVPGFDPTYAVAAGEIIWIGHGIVAMHPRAVVLAEAVRPAAGDRLLAGTLVPWRPEAPAICTGDLSIVKAACHALVRDLLRLETPRGFGAALAGGIPPFPLDCALPRVRALAEALDGADKKTIHAAALPLLGLGPGLTPSGDDLVGGVLFARRAMATSPADQRNWQWLALRLSLDCESRSHAIGAALFRDLAAGESFAPLHRMLDALVVDDLRRGVDAARELVAIGHSSGWDMLAGFVLGVGGKLANKGRER